MVNFKSIKSSEAARAADVLVREAWAVKSGEQFLIVADNDSDLRAVEAIASAAYSVGADPTIAVMTTRKKAGQGPSAIVEAALEKANVVVSLATLSMAHGGPMQRLLAEKRLRFCSMAIFDVEQMIRDSDMAGYRESVETARRLNEYLDNGTWMTITTEKGTNLTGKIAGMRKGTFSSSIMSEPGQLCCFPGGEAARGPQEGTAEGVVVVDGSVHQLGILREPIKLTVKKGRVISIEGGEQAARLREMVEGTPNTDNIAEMSMGTNRKSRLTGCLAEDKKMYGTAHVALGNNLYYGGKTNCAVHYDCLMMGVTVTIDGKTVVNKGEVVV